MEQFLRQLQTIPEAAELIRRVEEGGCPAAVSGLQPVQRACVGAAVAAACGRPAVFLCGDEREVQVLSADLETLTGRRPVTLLGREWQFRPGAVGSRDWERSRLAALYALAQGDAPVVVATADGLMARTLPPETCDPWPSPWRWGGRQSWARWRSNCSPPGIPVVSRWRAWASSPCGAAFWTCSLP